MLVGVGIPDEDSYFRRSYVPLPGQQTGWRRRVLQVMVVLFGLFALGGFVVNLIR